MSPMKSKILIAIALLSGCAIFATEQQTYRDAQSRTAGTASASGNLEKLKKEYEKVYLIRNERQLVLYSFDAGERFEPDYLMVLFRKNAIGFDQYQIFVEPKGNHLLMQDKWKEDFLLQIQSCGVPTKTFADDNHYHVWGLPFFNQDNRMTEFSAGFSSILQKESENKDDLGKQENGEII